MKIFAETPRLLLRELVADDAPGIFALDSDPAVLRYIGTPPHTSLAESLAVVEFVRAQYRENGIGRWAVVLKSSGEFIGWAGLKFIRETANNYSNYYDLGYRFQQKYWGLGYGYEAARACLQYGLKEMGLSVIHARAWVDNLASRRILEKLGFQFENLFEEEGRMVAWYSFISPA